MNVLLTGGGGREHALAWKLAQSPRIKQLFVAPGNGGTAGLARNVPIADTDVQALADFAVANAVDLVVAGPEASLVAGLADVLAARGIPCFGPDAFAARLEGSKVFAKTVMGEAGVPSAAYRVFTDFEAARAHILARPVPMVVKADGLAAGKGVVVAKTREEAVAAARDMLVDKAFGAAGETVIVEDCLSGEEASFLALCDGERIAVMPSCQDHKAVNDGDTGPNTGGMGAYSPAPVLPESRYAEMATLVIEPILRTLAAKGHPFRGVLYAGLMMTPDGPSVLEYNVRFGDPECQPLLMRLDADLLTVMLDCATGRLDPAGVRWDTRTALCVVLTAAGYPGSYPKGMAITGIEAAEADPLVKVFVAGAAATDAGLRTTGGRVLGVTALGGDLVQAQKRAYQAVQAVAFENCHYRRDIGAKGITRLQP